MHLGVDCKLKKEIYMKNLFMAFALVFGMTFVACDPVEDEYDAPKVVSEADFDVTAYTMTVTVDGETYDVGVVENHSPIPSWIEYVVPDYGDGSTISGIKNGTSLILRTLGTNTFIFHGMNPDGTEVVKTVTCECKNLKKVLPELETTVWEPLIGEDGNPMIPVLANWSTPEARFSDAEGIMGKWDAVKYDSRLAEKNVFIQFDKPWSGEWMICTGWWSEQNILVNNGKDVVSFYMTQAFVDACKNQDLAFIGRGVPEGDDAPHIIRMYTLMEL